MKFSIKPGMEKRGGSKTFGIHLSGDTLRAFLEACDDSKMRPGMLIRYMVVHCLRDLDKLAPLHKRQGAKNDG